MWPVGLFLQAYLVVYLFFSPLVIKAFDLDEGMNAMLTYTIIDELFASYFYVDSGTGVLKTLRNLDYEEFPVFQFHVLVSPKNNFHCLFLHEIPNKNYLGHGLRYT